VLAVLLLALPSLWSRRAACQQRQQAKQSWQPASIAWHSTTHLCLLNGPHGLPKVGQLLAAAAKGAAGLARPPRATIMSEQPAGEAALQGGGAGGSGRRAAVAHRAQQGRQGV
jgi:hypothetical protein